jgi:ADP-ribose pyrophosphatase YjhB (NUDIX family)
MAHPPTYIVNVEGVVVKDDRYLMVVRGDGEAHAPGALSLPGGKVDLTGDGDSVLEQTLMREVLEETGVEIALEMTYIESKTFVTAAGEPVVDVVFLCRYEDGEPTIGDPEEVAAVRWMTSAEIFGSPAAPAWTLQSISLAERRLQAAVR